MKKIAKILTVVLASILVTFFAMQPATVMGVSCPTGSINAEASSLAECNVKKDEEGKGLMPMVQIIINVVLSVLGIVAVIMIIMGAVTYTTSSGDAAKLTKAKNTIIYGVVGLVIALLAFAIVNFVLTSVFNGSVTAGNANNASQTEDN